VDRLSIRRDWPRGGVRLAVRRICRSVSDLYRGRKFPALVSRRTRTVLSEPDEDDGVEIQTTPEFRAGTPKLLFEGNYTNAYDVDPDRKRFLMIKPPTIQQRTIDQVNVVLNWFTELQQRVPTR
jgi:hypothetical protein